MVKRRAAGEASELLPCLQANGFGLSASTPCGGNVLQRSSCHLVPFGQGEVTSPVCGDQDHPQSFRLGGNALVWELGTCPFLRPGVDLGIVLLSQLFNREDNQAVRQAVQSLSFKVFKT